MRIMGLDLGTERIGVAVSDESRTLAQGRALLRRESDTAVIDRLISMIGELGVGEIVVGLPVNMDGSKGERALDSERFADKLRRRAELPVHLWDERLSTREAEAVMLEADLSRKKRKKSVDKLAAQLILQSYLDSRKRTDV
ncbi:MAG: Holliday junction resolvase RuvX [Candidatus Omnitrophica bacterium]|nr:Holliday junction resolvase RuvX [Candidatus Omnitrophota bacterium]